MLHAGASLLSLSIRVLRGYYLKADSSPGFTIKLLAYIWTPCILVLTSHNNPPADMVVLGASKFTCLLFAGAMDSSIQNHVFYVSDGVHLKGVLKS